MIKQRMRIADIMAERWESVACALQGGSENRNLGEREAARIHELSLCRAMKMRPQSTEIIHRAADALSATRIVWIVWCCLGDKRIKAVKTETRIVNARGEELSGRSS